MIERVHFKNFKSLADVTVPLSPFTLFVGANASGKTSILQATHDLLSLASTSTTRPESIFEGEHHPSRVVRADGESSLTLEVHGDAFGRFRADVSESDAEVSIKLQREWEGNEFGFPTRRPAGFPPGDRARDFENFVQPLRTALLGFVASFRLDARAAIRPHYEIAETIRVSPDGTGLPSVIQRLQLLRDGRFEQLEARLSGIVPSVRRLRALPHPVMVPRASSLTIDGQSVQLDRNEKQMGVRLEAELASGAWIPADLLSEGTILTLALLTVLIDEAPRTLLIDDLDHGLHPTAQTKLVETIREIQSQSAVQILATSHSPYLVDAFDASDVRVVALIDGATQVRSLNEHPRWNDASAVLDPGEFWSSVGEEWVGRRRRSSSSPPSRHPTRLWSATSVTES